MKVLRIKCLPTAAFVLVTLAPFPHLDAASEKETKQQPRTLDRILQEAEAAQRADTSTPGSLYRGSGRFGDLARDLRASQVNDLVTIVVYDKASALTKGGTKAERKSSAKASITAMGGPLKSPGPLTSLAELGGENSLDGQGETTRMNVLQTTLSARVTHVLPNGDLIVEGTKYITVNSENQRVTVRGLLRWNDLSTSNRVSSDRLAEMEVRVDGKGVVNDAIRRPNFLYRLLIGILPF